MPGVSGSPLRQPSGGPLQIRARNHSPCRTNDPAAFAVLCEHSISPGPNFASQARKTSESRKGVRVPLGHESFGDRLNACAPYAKGSTSVGRRAGQAQRPLVVADLMESVLGSHRRPSEMRLRVQRAACLIGALACSCVRTAAPVCSTSSLRRRPLCPWPRLCPRCPPISGPP